MGTINFWFHIAKKMLGVSLSEFIFTCIIAFLIIRPQDIKKVAYWYKYIFKQITKLKDIAQDSIEEINKELRETELRKPSTEPEYIIDNTNKIQKTYNKNPLKKD